MRVLLFQARDADDPMREHEQSCFADKLQAAAREGTLTLRTFNLVSEPPEEQACWQQYDVILVGGSGRYGCVENSTLWFSTFLQTLQQIVAADRPLFCSCFGHQALAVALGGKVVCDRPNAELGTRDIELTAEGLADPLYAGFPTVFSAQLGHNDRVTELPSGAVNLASTAPCPVQSYRLQGRLVYATQFHPELSHTENRDRAMGYLQVYDIEQTTPERLAKMFRPSPQASGLLPRFLSLVRERDVSGSV